MPEPPTLPLRGCRVQLRLLASERTWWTTQARARHTTLSALLRQAMIDYLTVNPLRVPHPDDATPTGPARRERRPRP